MSEFTYFLSYGNSTREPFLHREPNSLKNLATQQYFVQFFFFWWLFVLYTLDRHVLISQSAQPNTTHLPMIRFTDTWKFLSPIFFLSFYAKAESRFFGLFGSPIRTAWEEAVNREVPPKVLPPLMSKLQISQVLLSEVWKMKRRSLEPWN